MSNQTLSDGDIYALKARNIADNMQKVAPNRFSAVFVKQIALLPYAGPMNEAWQYIIPEIMHLEDASNLTKTKKDTAFMRPKMYGLYKKHFYLPIFAAKNLANFWKLNKEGSEKFDTAVFGASKCYFSMKNPSDEDSRKFIEETTSVFMKLPDMHEYTGEYIIFTKYQGQNYYLCLSPHSSDDLILDSVREAYKDFSFLLPIGRGQ